MKAANLALIVLASCATIPEPAGGGDNLPSAAAGPFRALVDGEIGGDHTAPNGFVDVRGYGRDIAVVDADGDPATLEVFAYVAAAVKTGSADPTPATPTSALVRYGAPDGRTFDSAAEMVLTADASSWEGGALSAPSAVRSGGEIFLYYAAAGGIGLAKSADGHAFTRVPGPVLAPIAGGWEQGAVPASPGVVVLPDGTFRMFYEVPGSPGGIGEATSTDGVAWSRLGDGPALAPTPAVDGGDPPYDGAWVGAPFPVLETSAVGRSILRVYYGARDATGLVTVGMAARFGTDGPLQRAVSPVFGTANTLGPREPCVVPFAGFTFLYATEQASSSDKSPVIAVGVAPATAALPPPAM